MLLPLHDSFTTDAITILSSITFGWVIVIESVKLQVFTPEIVTVYVPALRLETEAVVAPPGAHAYVYGPLPPVTQGIVALPLEPLKHVTFVVIIPENVG